MASLSRMSAACEAAQLWLYKPRVYDQESELDRQRCAARVGPNHGYTRQCSREAKETVGRYEWCKYHADRVTRTAQAIAAMPEAPDAD